MLTSTFMSEWSVGLSKESKLEELESSDYEFVSLNTGWSLLRWRLRLPWLLKLLHLHVGHLKHLRLYSLGIGEHSGKGMLVMR